MKQPKQRNERSAARLSDALDPWPSAEWKTSFRRRLWRWFRSNARALPWRETRDPYAIWVSEIMLQQTQVATVIPYYERFLTRFPTVADLAAADEQDVLLLWEGLGYYRRARQMYLAAQRIVAEHGGQFPLRIDAVRRLPGIGRYTAGAILSFAFDARLPILEANTLRLFARLLAFRGNPLAGAGQKLLWNAAETILPRRGSGELNQALMELGNQICTPRAPRCSRCPVAALCPTKRDDLQDVIPARTQKSNVEHVREASVVVRHRGKVLLVQRAAGQRWAGLWDFPRFPLMSEDKSAVHEELIDAVQRLCSMNIEPRRLLTTLRHGVTRFRITLECHEAQLNSTARVHGSKRATRNRARDPNNTFSDQRWVTPARLADYPLSATGRKIARLVMSAGSQVSIV